MEKDCLKVGPQGPGNCKLITVLDSVLDLGHTWMLPAAAEVPGPSVHVHRMGRSAFLPPGASYPEAGAVLCSNPVVGKQRSTFKSPFL